MQQLFSEFDLATYTRGVAFAATISKLYSSSATPLIDSRFVEKLFCHVTGSMDLSRSDMSFDAIYDQTAGVGVKTFTASSRAVATFEKVAEFTRLGVTLSSLAPDELVREVSRLRNLRIQSDSEQYAIDISRSFYHCLIRTPGSVFVHEERYGLVNIQQIVLLRSSANSINFTDGQNDYRFSRSKSVLMKKFKLDSGKNSPDMPATVSEGIWAKILESDFNALEQSPKSKELAQELQATRKTSGRDENLDFVVLPLYSTSSQRGKYIPERSGINQWNANGRKRKFGEAYIPVPKAIHNAHPGFFPARNTKFRLALPDGSIVAAKICQDGGKALMSDPNEIICKWLFAALDGSFATASERFESSRCYKYGDLEAIGRDSVKISKSNKGQADYYLELTEIDSYEEFIEVEMGEKGNGRKG